MTTCSICKFPNNLHASTCETLQTREEFAANSAAWYQYTRERERMKYRYWRPIVGALQEALRTCRRENGRLANRIGEMKRELRALRRLGDIRIAELESELAALRVRLDEASAE